MGFAGDFWALKMGMLPRFAMKNGFSWVIYPATIVISWDFHGIFMEMVHSTSRKLDFLGNFYGRINGMMIKYDQWVLQWPQTWLTGKSCTNGHFISTYRRIPCQNRTFSGLLWRKIFTGNHDFYSQI